MDANFCLRQQPSSTEGPRGFLDNYLPQGSDSNTQRPRLRPSRRTACPCQPLTTDHSPLTPEPAMNRKADAAGSKSTSSHPVARRLSRFKSRFPRLLRTDYWITSRRSLWATLFAREKSATSRRTRLVRRAHKTTVEGLEDRRLLANFSIAGGNLNLDLSDLNSSVALVAGATNYTLTLTGGTWSGTNSGSVTGNGTNTLTVTKDAFPLINVTDSNSGISVTFNDSGANTYTDDWSIVLDAAAASSISFNGATPFATTSNLSATTTKSHLV